MSWITGFSSKKIKIIINLAQAFPFDLYQSSALCLLQMYLRLNHCICDFNLIWQLKNKDSYYKMSYHDLKSNAIAADGCRAAHVRDSLGNQFSTYAFWSSFLLIFQTFLQGLNAITK